MKLSAKINVLLATVLVGASLSACAPTNTEPTVTPSPEAALKLDDLVEPETYPEWNEKSVETLLANLGSDWKLGEDAQALPQGYQILNEKMKCQIEVSYVGNDGDDEFNYKTPRYSSYELVYQEIADPYQVVKSDKGTIKTTSSTLETAQADFVIEDKDNTHKRVGMRVLSSLVENPALNPKYGGRESWLTENSEGELYFPLPEKVIPILKLSYSCPSKLDEKTWDMVMNTVVLDLK